MYFHWNGTEDKCNRAAEDRNPERPHLPSNNRYVMILARCTSG